MLDTDSEDDDYSSESDNGLEIADDDNIIPDDDTLWEPDSIIQEAPPQSSQADSTSYPPPTPSPIPSPPSSPPPSQPNAGRQNVENNLRQPVFVEEYTTKYPNSHAGCPLPDTARSATSFAQYGSKIADSDKNPYAPFANKINWDVAKWAKLRGPGSNSLAELLAIEGVSKHSFVQTDIFIDNFIKVPEALGLTFKTPQELNNIIDTKIPGRPQFHLK